jgi:hypothetical protein
MNYVDLAIAFGGFMAMDRPFLTNRLANFKTEQEKLAYIMPPASVINAYFAEIYQKQGAESATAYFLNLSKTFGNFSDQPTFELEGSAVAPTFRFIRLNLSGKSFGFAYENAEETALVFSEFADEPVTDDLLFEIAQLFPQYVVTSEKGKIKMLLPNFDEFGDSSEVDLLTTKAENADYIRLSTLNMAEGLAQCQKMVNNSINNRKMVQFKNREYLIYLSKH